MAEAYFYHLTRSPVETTLPLLLGRALGAGWRVEVRGRDPGRMAALDAALWLGPDDQFLPHGLIGGPHDADQPVLLTHAAGPANRPACLMTIDGATLLTVEAAALARVCVIFDGNDAAALTIARDQWRSLTGAGLAAQYWSEEGGRWQKKTERPATA